MTKRNPFRYFKTSPEIIRLAVMMYVRFPLSLRNVEDLLHERGIDVCHETIRFWWNRFGPMFASEIRKKRTRHLRAYSNWQWHLDEVFVKINGKCHYLFNNAFLGMVRQWQELFFDNRLSGVDLAGNPDFVKLAESFGAAGMRIRRAGDVRKVLQRAREITDRPVVVDACVEQTDNVFPMIPAGAAVSEMLIERPKRKLEKPTGST